MQQYIKNLIKFSRLTFSKNDGYTDISLELLRLAELEYITSLSRKAAKERFAATRVFRKGLHALCYPRAN